MFDLEVVSVIMMEALQRFNDEVIHRKPDRAPPVGVPPEQGSFRFTRCILHRKVDTVCMERKWILFINPGHCPHSIVGEEFIRVEHALEKGLHSVAPK